MESVRDMPKGHVTRYANILVSDRTYVTRSRAQLHRGRIVRKGPAPYRKGRARNPSGAILFKTRPSESVLRFVDSRTSPVAVRWLCLQITTLLANATRRRPIGNSHVAEDGQSTYQSEQVAHTK
jgi:hypothetical protein